MTRFLFLNYYYCRGMVACLSPLSRHHHLSLQYGTLLHCRHNWNIPVSKPLSYYLWLHPVPHTTDYIDLSLWSLLTNNPGSFTSQVKPTAHLGPQEHETLPFVYTHALEYLTSNSNTKTTVNGKGRGICNWKSDKRRLNPWKGEAG